MKDVIRVAHVINALNVGGAETMLLKLLSHTDRQVFSCGVYSLLAPAGPIAGNLRDLGISVRELGIEQRMPNPLRVLQLRQWLQRDAPDIVQTWMYHGDLVGGLAAKMSDMTVPVIWNVRNSTLDALSSKRRTFWVVNTCARLSRWVPDSIICCSVRASQVHAALGYPADKMQVVPNGFDLDAFRPGAGLRQRLRNEIDVPDHAPLIGLVARLDPQKDHRTFLAGAGRLHRELPEVRFLLCGRGVTSDNPQLSDWIRAERIGPACRLLGERHDMPAVNAALDIATSSSAYGEAFPNAIGEAMACGVPCVVTDVGDSAHIVGATGAVVPIRDPDALSEAWKRLLRGGHERLERLGLEARERVGQQFSIKAVVRTYEDVYQRHTLARARRGAPGAHRAAPPPVPRTP